VRLRLLTDSLSSLRGDPVCNPSIMQQQASRSLLRAAHASFQKAWLNSIAAPAAAACYSTTSSSSNGQIKWVFLGPPGVGKGTYASRVAAALDVPHIAAGDLVRAEIKSGSTLGQQVCRFAFVQPGVAAAPGGALRQPTRQQSCDR
jgi:hypothetical protein